mmetsp:Transcript_23997/g.58528  ORF Transcript_23997/g.58528 Transcript_23997/m.58528 type:complete len:285 (+) Transcript_23997:52-906(+)
MCFSGEMAGAFALLGWGLAYYVHAVSTNRRLAVGVAWFALMETLQFFQYMVIDDCGNWWNQFLTWIGFVHICYQPYFTHIINSALTKNPRFLTQYDIILRLCLLGGSMLLARNAVAHLLPSWQTPVQSAVNEWAADAPNATVPTTAEWLRGDRLCTYRGKYHLAWSVPMVEVTYWIPSAAIHSFLMFAPFFVMKWNMVIQGVFLWAAGPFLASFITPNLQEQASIWCFFSIAQIGIMLFLIRETLILRWGRDKPATDRSLHAADRNGHAAKNGHAKNGKRTKAH